MKVKNLISQFKPKYIIAIKEIILKKGQNIYEILQENRIKQKEISDILKKIKPHLDLRQIREGSSLNIFFKQNRLSGVSLKIDKIQELQIIKIVSGLTLRQQPTELREGGENTIQRGRVPSFRPLVMIFRGVHSWYFKF